MAKVAVVCNTGLGDGIVFERLAHALSAQGCECTIYSNFLLKLGALYPGICLKPYPQDIEDPSSSFWQEYSHYFFQEYAPCSCSNFPKIVLGESYREKKESWLDLQARYLLKNGFRASELKSSLKAPAHWQYRLHKNRVMIHPTSLKEEKNWPSYKFIQLAIDLQKEGWEVIFCATQEEKPTWDLWLREGGLQPLLALNLEACAQMIYESAYFIGNDSGIAHLAPALEIPTLKIFDRLSRAVFWSGGWDHTQEVLPWPIPMRSWRVRYWKQWLPVSRVKKAFIHLVESFPIK